MQKWILNMWKDVGYERLMVILYVKIQVFLAYITIVNTPVLTCMRTY